MDWDNDHRKVSSGWHMSWALRNCGLSYPSQKQEDDKSHHCPWWLPGITKHRAMSDRLKLQVSCGCQSKPSRSTEIVFLVMWKLANSISWMCPDFCLWALIYQHFGGAGEALLTSCSWWVVQRWCVSFPGELLIADAKAFQSMLPDDEPESSRWWWLSARLLGS